MTATFRTALSLLGPLLLAGPALAQWSHDPAVNLPVGDAASDQNQVKMVTTLDGGVWMSWLDGIGSGWDVRVQKLDRPGNERLPHNGVLVADRSFSSTQDYGLGMAHNGDALLAYRDDSSGSTEIAANRVDAAGNLVWGAGGVALTSGAGFVAAPKIVRLDLVSDREGAMVAWTENAEVKIMRLSAAGVPQWAAPVTLTAPTGSYLLSDMRAGDGDVVISMVHQTGGFTSPKHLVAQMIDENGAPQWGATPIGIFDGGSLQFGNFPSMLKRTGAHTIFTWYSSYPALQCFVQKVDSAGVEAWAHNGVAVADVAGQLRVNPHASYDSNSDTVYVAWKELNGSQSQSGISAQRLDSAGNRLWGTAGTTLEPLGTDDHNMPCILGRSSDGSAIVVWSASPAFGNDPLFGAVLDSVGAVQVPRFDVASTPSGKARLAIEASTDYAVLAWSDARNDGGDIYAQAVSFEGLLEAPFTGVPFCSPGNTNSTGQGAELTGDWITGLGISGGLADVHLEVTGGPPGQLGYFLVGTEAQAGIPISNGQFCLVGSGGIFYRYNVAGTSMNSIGGFDASGTLVNSVGTSATGTGFDIPSTITSFAIMAGDTWHFQCWYRDTLAGVGSSNFSSALSVTF